MSLNLVKILIFSLAVTSVFTKFKNNFKNYNIYHWFCALLLLPATIAAILLIKINVIQPGIITTTNLNLIPFIDFELYIEPQNIIVISLLIILVQSFLFLKEKIVFLENFTIIILTVVMLVLMQIFSNLLCVLLIFIIGNVLITSERIASSGDSIPIKDLTRDFMWQRISDFINIIGLLIMTHQTESISAKKISNINIENNYIISTAIFASIIIKIISIKPTRNDSITLSSIFHASNIQYKFYTACGSIILATKMKILIFNHLSTIKLHQIITAILLLTAFINMVTDRKKQHKEIFIIFLTATISLFIASVNANYLYSLILIIIITILIQLLPQKNINSKSTIKIKLNSIDIISSLNLIFKKLILFLSKISDNFIHPFYASFLLYRLPQLFVSIIQIPLRFFHNGSIQRSLLFIVMMLMFYYYIWGLQ